MTNATFLPQPACLVPFPSRGQIPDEVAEEEADLLAMQPRSRVHMHANPLKATGHFFRHSRG